MDNAEFMVRIIESHAELADPPFDILDAIPLPGPVHPHGRQRPAIHKFRNNGRRLVIPDEIECGGDVRMHQHRVAARLLLQPREDRLVGQQHLGQKFQSHLATRSHVVRQPDFGESAPAQQPFQNVTAATHADTGRQFPPKLPTG